MFTNRIVITSHLDCCILRSQGTITCNEIVLPQSVRKQYISQFSQITNKNLRILIFPHLRRPFYTFLCNFIGFLNRDNLEYFGKYQKMFTNRIVVTSHLDCRILRSQGTSTCHEIVLPQSVTKRCLSQFSEPTSLAVLSEAARVSVIPLDILSFTSRISQHCSSET